MSDTQKLAKNCKDINMTCDKIKNIVYQKTQIFPKDFVNSPDITYQDYINIINLKKKRGSPKNHQSLSKD